MGPDGEQSSHVASTVEMTSTIAPCKIHSLTGFPTQTGNLENWECILQPEEKSGNSEQTGKVRVIVK